MTAKTAATAIAALTSIITLAGCTPSQASLARTSPGAFDALHGADTRLVAGDALGVEMHLAATSATMLAHAR